MNANMKKIICLIASTVVIVGQTTITNAQKPVSESQGSEIAEILCMEFVEEDSTVVLEEVEQMIAAGEESFSLEDLDTLDYVAKQLKSGHKLNNLCSY